MHLSPGDPAPLFEARTGGTPNFPFHAVAGRPIVLSFLGSLQNPVSAKAVHDILERHREWLDDEQACFFGVSADPSDEQRNLLRDQMPGVRFIRDFDHKISRQYGAIGPSDAGRSKYQMFTLVLDAMLRVFASIPMDETDRHNIALDRAITRIKTVPQSYSPPVLVLPGVFEEELCGQLIAMHQADGRRSSGVMEDTSDRTVEINDARSKARRDLMITDPALQIRLRDRLGQRLIPSIMQCFQFRVTHLERYLIGCYDAAESGFFKAHRDNVTRGTAHRRLALTVQLNEDYEGGELVFPEFGAKTYKAGVGSAIVFSCSLMHAVMPVRRGKRFAFLPFLHDEAAELIRLQNHKFIVSNE
jgi:predicted 2-oxoglutarate/Fe(II)-dependent dioxygenase YbiX/peroxiredoxin